MSTTLEEVLSKVPKDMKKRLTQTSIDIINRIEDGKSYDEGEFSDLLVNYNHILQSGRYKVDDYIKAVHFVGIYQNNGGNQSRAWCQTFPDKVEARRKRGMSDYTSGGPPEYFGSKLVQSILAQAVIPTRIFHAHKEHEAVIKLHELMMNKSGKTSERIQMESANSLLSHLKAPDAAKVEIDIGVTHSVADDYEAAMNKMVESQLDLIAKGGDIKAITNASIKKPDVDVIDVEAE